MGVTAPRWQPLLHSLERRFFAFLTTDPLSTLPSKVERRAALVSSRRVRARRVNPRRLRMRYKLIGVVPRDGIEPPKNLDINGLDTAFNSDFTSIPDKIPDKKIKA